MELKFTITPSWNIRRFSTLFPFLSEGSKIPLDGFVKLLQGKEYNI